MTSVIHVCKWDLRRPRVHERSFVLCVRAVPLHGVPYVGEKVEDRPLGTTHTAAPILKYYRTPRRRHYHFTYNVCNTNRNAQLFAAV